MKLLQAKLAKYDAPQKAKAAGVYPYFRKIESEQDTEVLINGKKVLMFGSNSYLGLTNHPKVIEAAVEAAKACKGKPTAIIAKSTKGKGVSFMENQVGWHGKVPSGEQLTQALEELEGRNNG